MRDLLFNAIEMRNEKLSIWILQNGVNFNCLNAQGFSPLHLAAKYGLVQLARFLILQGATLNDRYVSALHYAVWSNQLEIAHLLLDHGANVDQPYLKDAATPLFLAIACRNYELCKILLNRGANVNYRLAISLKTPLHMAAYSCDRLPRTEEIVQLLIERGAKINPMDVYNLTPLYIAAKRGNFKSYNLIMKSGGVGCTCGCKDGLDTIIEE